MSSIPVLTPAPSLQGLQLGTATPGQQLVFKPDRPSLITEVRFFSTVTLSAATAVLQAAGITLYGGALVPIPLLVQRSCVDVQSGVMGYLYIMRPDQPWMWSQEMPFYVTPSAACTITVVGYPLPSAVA